MTKIVNVIEFYPQDIYNSKDIQVTFDNGIIFFFYYIKIRHFSSNWFRLSVTQFSHPVMSDSVTPWTAARQASLSITNSRSFLKLMSIASVMPFNHLILSFIFLMVSFDKQKL